MLDNDNVILRYVILINAFLNLSFNVIFMENCFPFQFSYFVWWYIVDGFGFPPVDLLVTFLGKCFS